MCAPAIIAFGRAVLFSYRCSFSRCERENEQQKMGKYHAAAGKYQLEAATA
jgi:hypothetical protein